MLFRPEKIDLHMHTCFSDGTDTPEELIEKLEDAGIELFSVTDHDTVRGAEVFPALLKEDSPHFISGVEFSCRDKNGQYHILGYNYDPEGEAVRKIVERGHRYRIEKAVLRMDFIRDEFGFDFFEEDREEILSLNNPGKPHIANMMVKYGYVKNKEEGICEYLNKAHIPNKSIRPEEAIEAVLESGGIPVLAHPFYGSGDQLIIGDEMDKRLKFLTECGLEGVEAYYSGFSGRLIREMLEFSEKYHLYVTAGSDYHGRNKLIALGDNNLGAVSEGAGGLHRFLERVLG